MHQEELEEQEEYQKEERLNRPHHLLRHPTGPVTKSQNTWFLINYAIAGISGWPYDLERYGNESDMWVDWVRVYEMPGQDKAPTVAWRNPSDRVMVAPGEHLDFDVSARASAADGWISVAMRTRPCSV